MKYLRGDNLLEPKKHFIFEDEDCIKILEISSDLDLEGVSSSSVLMTCYVADDEPVKGSIVRGDTLWRGGWQFSSIEDASEIILEMDPDSDELKRDLSVIIEEGNYGSSKNGEDKSGIKA